MRIGLFTEVYKPYVSGVVTSIMMLKKSLEQLGHEVYIVSINMDKVKYEYAPGTGTKDDILYTNKTNITDI